MTENDALLLSEDINFGPLLALCKSGPKRDVPIPSKNFLQATSESDFCAICAENMPEVSLYLKLFDLEDWFIAHAPRTPTKSSSTSAANYLQNSLTLLQNYVSSLPSKKIEDMVHASVTKYGGQFNGKLIHTSVENTALFAPNKDTDQPHLSSRSLRKNKIKLPLDQQQCDLTGGFQRLTKIVENDSLVKSSGFPLSVQKIIKTEFENTLVTLRTREPVCVDHRLRQILMPDSTDYVALSPLATGSIGVLLHAARATYEDEQTTENEPDTDTPTRKKYFDTIEFLVGGANSRNASAHWTNRYFQRPLYFRAPQKDQNIHSLWNFIYRSWRPWISISMANTIAEQFKSLSHALDNSSTLTAVAIQETKALTALVEKCHEQAQALSERLSLQSIEIKGELRSIDTLLVSTLREKPVLPLDKCLIEQDTGSVYRDALSDSIVTTLWSMLEKIPSHVGALSALSNRQRLQRAICKILEKV